MPFIQERRSAFCSRAEDQWSVLARVPIILFLGVVLAGCAFSQRPLPAQTARFDTCSPEVVEQYFNANPLQSALFERNDMGAFIGQFALCKHQFILAVPTFTTTDGQTLSMPYKISIDTKNGSGASGCVRRETVTSIPVKFVTYCFSGMNFIKSEQSF